MRKSYVILALFSFFAFAKAYSQGITLQPKKPTASEIYEDLKKLNFLGSVLYVAAHPDDENTTAISYFANTVKARTAYLSLTRGDGGQNIIGPELRELLGVIRTQELLAARATDGGEQLFTRANDFGYSKHPDETLAIWNKDEVLGDVVWAIRTFKPDVIINRFNHRTPGSTHGHHTSSAKLAVEAFDLASDPTKYKDQLQYTQTWKPSRQFFNTSWWFYGSRENFEKADKSNLVKVDVGTYYPSLGLSNTEISSLSRSQHKSQGFGNTGSRGTNETYFELLKGEMPTNDDIFQGINTSWTRVQGGKEIKEIIDGVIVNFDFTAPDKSVPRLMEAYKRIQNLDNEHWKQLKSQEIKKLITACAGIYLEAAATAAMVTTGEQIDIAIEAINRSNSDIALSSIEIVPTGTVINTNRSLENNEPFGTKIPVSITDNFRDTSAYWLREEGTLGMYNVSDRRLIGKPETPQENIVKFSLKIEGVVIDIKRPIVYKYNDRVKGEVYEPFEVVPAVSSKLDSKVIIFEDDNSKKIPITVTAHKNNLKGSLTLDIPAGWKISPENYEIGISEKGLEKEYIFTVTPPTGDSEGYLTPIITSGGQKYSKELVIIDYGHIPLQSLFLPNKAKVVKLDIKREGNYIGYIQGAGDAVPENLTQIGYQVAIIDPSNITAELLSQFDAVVVGIRAYNVIDDIQTKQPLLLDYVKSGGTLIAQYNTSGRWGNTEIGAPYNLQLSRDRVTDENSEVRIIASDHPIMNFPNKITQKDFDGWTQERGLYFPNEWADEYTPILSMNDAGESPKNGSLLVAPYGNGHYIYTGLSFFRELPAGVAGAYRLFANMLSISKQERKNVKQ